MSWSAGRSEVSSLLLLSCRCWFDSGEGPKEKREAGFGFNVVQGSCKKSNSKGTHTGEAGAKGNVMQEQVMATSHQ